MKFRLSGVSAVMAGVSIGMLLILASCSKTDQRSNKLLTQAEVTSKEIDYLKKKNFLGGNEEITHIYTPTKITVQAVMLTSEKILAYHNDTVEMEPLSNIFDLSASHSVDVKKTSTITVYRKDDTTFKLEFIGASDVDEKFFLTLRDMWRAALAAKEVSAPVSDTTADTVSLQ